MSTIKYRTIKSEDNVVVILEDGGIADIHYAEESVAGDGRMSTSEYYQSRFTEDDLKSEECIWDIVGEGKMYYNDWTTPFDDPEHITDALQWLASGCEYELDESIWPDFKL